MIRRKILIRRLPAPVVLGAAPWPAVAGGDVVREMGAYTTAFEDSLLDVARRSDLEFVELRAANPGVDPWLPGTDTRIVLSTVHILPDARREGIVLNLAEMRLL